MKAIHIAVYCCCLVSMFIGGMCLERIWASRNLLTAVIINQRVDLSPDEVELSCKYHRETGIMECDDFELSVLYYLNEHLHSSSQPPAQP